MQKNSKNQAKNDGFSKSTWTTCQKHVKKDILNTTHTYFDAILNYSNETLQKTLARNVGTLVTGGLGIATPSAARRESVVARVGRRMVATGQWVETFVISAFTKTHL